MSETVNFTPERQEQLIEAGAEEKLLKAHTESHAETSQESPDVETLHQAAEQAALTSEQVQLPADTETPPVAPYLVSQETRHATTYLALKHLRRRLNAPERALSRIVHQPAIQAVSEAAGKTVSRPSGLLGGGLLAFVGSLVYLYLTKHIGFRYNYLLFLLFFAGGFAVGVIIELLLFAFRRKAEG